ncbi:hypothetical protein IFT48_03045 [Pseudomonas fluorescens]|uniref:hypothetical protein n=1 Tax=Pseudomonas fluorescens TaxID=294 RepID=UPI001930D863|nr:hypothetical protein [Pseudomonas fluorescens]MBD8088944.1 hypothetical protein [Pseudomonas fluorescens]
MKWMSWFEVNSILVDEGPVTQGASIGNAYQYMIKSSPADWSSSKWRRFSMSVVKSVAAETKPPLMQFFLLALLAVLVWSVGLGLIYVGYQNSKRADERVASWASAYTQVSSGSAKTWFSPLSVDDCMKTLEKLSMAGFSYQVDGKVQDGLALLTTCKKSGSHAITYWR